MVQPISQGEFAEAKTGIDNFSNSMSSALTAIETAFRTAAVDAYDPRVAESLLGTAKVVSGLASAMGSLLTGITSSLDAFNYWAEHPESSAEYIQLRAAAQAFSSTVAGYYAGVATGAILTDAALTGTILTIGAVPVGLVVGAEVVIVGGIAIAAALTAVAVGNIAGDAIVSILDTIHANGVEFSKNYEDYSSYNGVVVNLSSYADQVITSQGNDIIHFSGGNDIAFLSQGSDVFDGGSGSDTVDGTATGGIEVVEALVDNVLTFTVKQVNSGDTTTVTGFEYFKGSDSVDTFSFGDIQGERDQRVWLGDGDDTVRLGGTGGATVFGGQGEDTLTLTDPSVHTQTTIDLNQGLAWLGARDSGTPFYVTEIENVIGGDGRDEIVGDSYDNKLSGMSGNDTLVGGMGEDVIAGGDGADILVGGQAKPDPLTAYDLSVAHTEWDDRTRDYLDGGAGVDDYYLFSSFVSNPDYWPYQGEFADVKAQALQSCDLIASSDADFTAHFQFYSALDGGGLGIAACDLTSSQLASAWNGSTFQSFALSTTWVENPEFGDAYPYLYLTGELAKDASGRYFVLLSTDAYRTQVAYLGGYGVTVSDVSATERMTYSGSSGADNVAGETSSNKYYTGDGDDHITGNMGTDTAYAGKGADTFNGGGGADTAYGGEGNDALNGEDDDDILSGDGGNDAINGGQGNDIALFAGSYYRYVITRLTDGSLFVTDSTGQEGIDQLSGIETVRFFESWDNIVTSTVVVNSLCLYGTADGDSILGTFGNDDVVAYAGNDIIDGANGDDRLFGGLGSDTLKGGAGDDTLDGGAGYDVLIGGIGNDIAQFYGDSYQFVVTYLQDGSLFVTDTSGDGGTDELSGVETLRFYGRGVSLTDVSTLDVQGAGIWGTAGGEYIAGTAGADVIVAQDGDDTIESGDGDDRLFGGKGNDSLNGGAGDDLLDGGDGDADWASYWSSTSGIVLNLQTHSATGDGSDTLISIENVWGTDFNDEMTGDDKNNGLYGSVGDDVLRGAGGDDELDGGSGNDTLSGGAGDDHLYGGEGDDTLDGGAGSSDWVSYWDANGVTVSLGDGTATGHGTDTISNVENVWGSVGNDSITGNGLDNGLYGSDGNDFIWGVDGYNTMDGGAGDDDIVSGHGNDIIEGGEGVDTIEYWWSTGGVTVNLTAGTAHGDGDDTLSGIENVVGSSFSDTLIGNEIDNQLYGDVGNDALSGLAGNDYLNAGEGNDILNGGAGVDYLVGGDGSDTFRFDPNFGHDTVEDFSLGDVIEFASSVFADFGDVLSAATEVDGSTVITLDGDNSVTLQNVALASLSADEFRFAA